MLVEVQKKYSFSHIVAGASAFSRGVVPRAAALLKSSPLSDVTQIHDESTFTRPTYAGNANTKVLRGIIILIFIRVESIYTFNCCLACLIQFYVNLEINGEIIQVKSSAPVKLFTVRSTAFEPSPSDGGSAAVEKGKFMRYYN